MNPFYDRTKVWLLERGNGTGFYIEDDTLYGIKFDGTSFNVTTLNVQDITVTGTSNLQGTVTLGSTLDVSGITSLKDTFIDGKLGIGNSAPDYYIDVKSSGSAFRYLKTSVSSSDAWLSFGSGTSNPLILAPLFMGKSNDAGYSAMWYVGDIKLGENSGSVPFIKFEARYNNSSISTASSRPLFQFKSYTSAKLTIMPSGNVGIGTSVPKKGLHLYGTSGIEDLQQTKTGTNGDWIHDIWSDGSYRLYDNYSLLTPFKINVGSLNDSLIIDATTISFGNNVKINGKLNVYNSTSLNSTLYVLGATSLASTLTVTGTTKTSAIITKSMYSDDGINNIIIGSTSNTNSGSHTFIGGSESCSISAGIYDGAIIGSNGSSIASGNQSFIGGGITNSISGAMSGCIGGINNSLSSNYSVILGGVGIVGTLSSYVYVPSLNINTTPATNSESNPAFLIRNVTSKNVEQITEEAWHVVGAILEPAFQNSWANYNTTYGNLHFKKDLSNNVHIQGVVKAGIYVNGTVIFTLPTGYLPYASLILSTFDSDVNKLARVDVQANGDVVIYGLTTNTWVPLEINFHIA